MKWSVLPYSASNFEGTKYLLVNFTNFPVIKNTIKRISFENAYESSIIFSAFVICQRSCRISVLCAHFQICYTFITMKTSSGLLN